MEQTPQTLVVDLDGTLLNSDMLYETFWSSLAHDWKTPFRAAAALSHGKAALKRLLAERSSVDVTTLPYNEAVIARLTDWRAAGGRTALVTATDQSLADAIATHLGLFDDVIGSDGQSNLKGAHKAEMLVARYGGDKGGFTYVGDHAADLAVWAVADGAITVNAKPALRARVTCKGEIEHLGTSKRDPQPYFKAIRPHQWLKNLLIFLPMLTAHELSLPAFFLSLISFVAFSLIASSVYVLNDLLDLKGDRAHPRKRRRPFAAGTIPIARGTVMAIALLCAGLIPAVLLGGLFLQVLIAYYILTTAYSLYLKRQLVMDIFALAALYTIRILAGAAGTGIPISVWLLAFSIFFFFSLAAVKRQAELVDSLNSGKLKAHGRGYHVNDVPIVAMMALSSGYVSVLVMALYLKSPEIAVLYSAPGYLWGACMVVLFWLSRIVMVTHRGQMNDDPVLYAAKDRVSLICFALILALGVAGATL
ncbi:UbiA family prenyltransferase [Celeribacter neptunius]|uniref:4-hydroxybenzoate polyprenyltransferase n=1 Tax=Celeribacter neptunius TaxID=588602 RepID=A0A1I3PL33_9RHOB|nr:UbiA family prenyltransferase [Celeribacter neptunius]SFJ22041.1 4-hydroxybenzoate polyprenyltransferase [Celeribacter neptunius]